MFAKWWRFSFAFALTVIPPIGHYPLRPADTGFMVVLIVLSAFIGADHD